MATSKKIAVLTYSALLAVVGLSFFKGGKGRSHTTDTDKTEGLKREKSTPPINHITLDKLIITNKDAYLCYEEDPALKEFASLTDAKGNHLFTCEELFAYKKIGGDLHYAKDLVSLTYMIGGMQFAGRDIFAYKEAGGTAAYAQKFLSIKDAEGKNMFTPAQLPQFYRLGLDLPDLLEFKDTLKPDALAVYPTSDNNPDGNGAYKGGVFRNDDSVKFFREMKKAYDLKVIVATEENQVYQALSLPTHFTYLLLAGHGDDDVLTLGRKDAYYNPDVDEEKFHIDTSDTEFESYLQNLAPQAVVFLYSCKTGKALAPKIAGWAHGRKVIAPTDVLSTNHVTVRSFYPFEVTLSDGQGKDITSFFLKN